jgi:hypothetical protein
MNNKEVMQMALDALNNFDKGNHGMRWQAPVIKALRARLAQPEPAQCDGGQCGIGGYCKQCPKTQLEQEPVAWGIANTRPTEKQPLMMVMLDKPEPSHLVVALYTAPPQREWVGLTGEELQEIYQGAGTVHFKFAMVEAKLKEKNA